MAHDRVSVDSRWWYATVGIIALFFLYVSVSPLDSLLAIILNAVTVVGLALFWAMDIRVIRRSEAAWEPSALYLIGVILTPILVLYGYRRYQHVGLV
ncbi:hypothetical protein D3261_03210 [Halococcus sp. IIIV-5B]|nr:hypothetical protein D3261_03210 [Halococcus sp. IIIV-5B]